MVDKKESNSFLVSLKVNPTKLATEFGLFYDAEHDCYRLFEKVRGFKK